MHVKNDNLNITDFLHQAEKVEVLISWEGMLQNSPYFMHVKKTF